MRTLRRTSVGTLAATVLLATGVVALTAHESPAAAPTPQQEAAAAPRAPKVTLSARPARPQRKDRRPNIVLITTDDQTLTDMRWMPKTRRLIGRHGVTFPRAINPHPLCCPARAEILTGQYAQNNGVRSNLGAYGGYPALDYRNTVATWLDRAGYQTAFVGKYLNGYTRATMRDGVEPGWDVWNPTIGGVYSYYGFTNWENGTPRRYRTVHNADYVGTKTVEYIERFSRRSKPFFIWASQVAPHGACVPKQELRCWEPAVPATRHADLFQHARPPALADPSFNEINVFDKHEQIRTRDFTKPSHMRRIFRQRIRSLQAVDEAVERTVRALKRAGELGRTVIVFTSDNGYLLGEHRMAGKNAPYRQALSVPMLVRGPGIPAGVTRPQTAMTIDLAPTFAAWAQARPGLRVDGRSLIPMLRRASAPGVDTALIQSGPESEAEDSLGWHYRGVHTRRYTYAYWYGEGFTELYDRKVDPYEMNSVAGTPEYAQIEAELARRTAILGGCAGRSCRTDFAALPAPLPRPKPLPLRAASTTGSPGQRSAAADH